MIGSTTGGRWSALGISPSDATQTVSAMRELGGSKYVSNQEAYAGAKLGTYLGFSPEQTAQVGGAAGRLGVSPETAIRTIAAGVERGNQQGRQFEVASASLDYLKQIATSAAVSGTTGLTAITNLTSILAKTGIAAFQGAGGVSAIGGIEAAHSADDIFGVKAMGAAFAQYGEASMLRGAHGNIAKAEEIRQGGFGGRFSSIYASSIHGEIAMARKFGPLGYEALEEQWGMPIGSYIDPRTGKPVSVNSALDDLDQAIQSGDYLKAAKIQNSLLDSGSKNISPMAAASAGLATGGALTGEATQRTYAAGARLETAGLSLLRRHLDDKAGASALDYLSSTLGPSKPTPAPGLAYVPEPPLPPGGLPTPLATPFATPDALPTPGAPAYAAPAAGAPIAGAGALSGLGDRLGDSVSGGVLLIAGLLERLIAAVQGGSALGAPSPAPTPAAPAPTPAHGPIAPTASTPKSSRH